MRRRRLERRSFVTDRVHRGVVLSTAVFANGVPARGSRQSPTQSPGAVNRRGQRAWLLGVGQRVTRQPGVRHARRWLDHNVFEPVLPSLLSRQRSGCESNGVGDSTHRRIRRHHGAVTQPPGRLSGHVQLVDGANRPACRERRPYGPAFGSVSPFRRPDPNAAPRARVCVLTRSTGNETGFARRALLLLTCALVALPDIEARPVEEREPEWVSRLRS